MIYLLFYNLLIITATYGLHKYFNASMDQKSQSILLWKNTLKGFYSNQNVINIYTYMFLVCNIICLAKIKDYYM